MVLMFRCWLSCALLDFLVIFDDLFVSLGVFVDDDDDDDSCCCCCCFRGRGDMEEDFVVAVVAAAVSVLMGGGLFGDGDLVWGLLFAVPLPVLPPLLLLPPLLGILGTGMGIV